LLGQTLAGLQPAALKKHLWLPMLIWGALACAYPFAGRFASAASPLPVVQDLGIGLAVGGGGFLLCAALAWRFLGQEKMRPAIMLLAAGSLWGISMVSVGHHSYGQMKSSQALVERVRSHLRPDMEIFSVRTYEQTFPFYLRRPVILVEYHDEFSFGQQAEPGKAIATLGEFIGRWQAAPHAMAMLQQETFDELREQGVAMQPVYQDGRRMVVIKP